jgi:hypothetical protein
MHSHILNLVVLASLGLIFVAGSIYTLTKSADIRFWVGGAWAAFVNGFVDGFPIGTPSGAGFALADGQVHADLGLRHIAIEVAHLLAIPFFTGMADVRSFRQSNPFPNPFTAPIHEIPPGHSLNPGV